jgi:hypothetical protein
MPRLTYRAAVAKIDQLAQRFPLVAGMMIGAVPFALVAIIEGV